MNYSVELFEKYKAAKGYSSDRQAAVSLGVTPRFITRLKAGYHWSDEKAVYLAECCGIDPREALAHIALDKAAPEHRELWADIVKRLRLGQLCAVVGALLGSQIINSAQCNGNSNSYGLLTA